MMIRKSGQRDASWHGSRERRILIVMAGKAGPCRA